jgi:hypothetical protein
MASIKEKKEVFDYWNSKGIVLHKKMTPDQALEIGRNLNYYSKEDLFKLIDFYATILEPGVQVEDKKFFWSYKWNLYEFLKRGVKKFDGQTTDNYLRKQNVMSSKGAVIIEREEAKLPF